MRIPQEVLQFLQQQGIVTVSTLDSAGAIHCAVKGIVGFENESKVLIIDLYKGRTYRNLKKNPNIAISAINEKKFTGWCLQGQAKIVYREDMAEHVVQAWEDRVIRRITERLIKGVQTGAKSTRHHEAELPAHPKYFIEIDVKKVVDLAPPRARSSQKKL